MSFESYFSLAGFLPWYPLAIIGALVVAYFCGSVPVALIIGRTTANIDIREHGSGNAGTTNALRVLGWLPGLIVFCFDVLKGALACLIMSFVLALLGTHVLSVNDLLATPDAVTASYAIAITGSLHDIPLSLALLASIAGHMFSPFMRFKGGKGIACGLGALMVVVPLVGLSALAVFVVITLITRYVSLGSVLASISLPFATLLYYGNSLPYIIFMAIMAVVLVAAHHKNIKRLLRGEEARFSAGKKGASANKGSQEAASKEK